MAFLLLHNYTDFIRIPVRALRCPGIRRRQAQLPRHGRRRSRSASQRTVRYRIRRSTLRHQACARKVRGARRLGKPGKGTACKGLPSLAPQLSGASRAHRQHRGSSGAARRRLLLPHRGATQPGDQAIVRTDLVAHLVARRRPLPRNMPEQSADRCVRCV